MNYELYLKKKAEKLLDIEWKISRLLGKKESYTLKGGLIAYFVFRDVFFHLQKDHIEFFYYLLSVLSVTCNNTYGVKGQLVRHDLSNHYVGVRDQIQIFKFSTNHCYLLSYFEGHSQFLQKVYAMITFMVAQTHFPITLPMLLLRLKISSFAKPHLWESSKFWMD